MENKNYLQMTFSRCPSVLNKVSTDMTLFVGEDFDTLGLKPFFLNKNEQRFCFS